MKLAKSIKCLRKRREWLLRRIANSKTDLSFDKAEAAAIAVILSKLQELGFDGNAERESREAHHAR